MRTYIYIWLQKLTLGIYQSGIPHTKLSSELVLTISEITRLKG